MLTGTERTMPDKPKQLYLIDGTALAYRGYYAFIRNPLINSRGENVSATFGFTNSLMSLIREQQPDFLAIVFDTGRPTFRHEMYDQYKATRQKMPDDMIDQLPRIREAVEALGIPRIEVDGYEADDVIGTLAVRAEHEGLDVVMVTGDKDFMQLVNDHICMFVPMKNDRVCIGDVEARYGVPPERITDLLGLMGDASDNIPGLPGVGEKTAVGLLKQFGSLEAVLDRTEEIGKPSIRKSAQEYRDQALLSRRLAVIRTDVPLECDIDSLEFSGFRNETAREFLREMEFTRLLDSLGKTPDEPRREAVIVTTENLNDFFTTAGAAPELSVDTETTSLDVMCAGLVGVSIASRDGVWYLPVAHRNGNNLPWDSLLPRLKKLLEDPRIPKTGHNLKYDAAVLRRHGIELNPTAFDTFLAAYLLEPGSRGYSLGKLSEGHLNHRMQSITELIGKGKNQRCFDEVEIEPAARYSGDDADVALRLKGIFEPRLVEENLTALFTDIEMPLMRVLLDMEMHGVSIDTDFLGVMSGELAESMVALERSIYDTAGQEFNINSPKQLGEILFDKLGLKSRRRTKTGYSTDSDTLSLLAGQHPLPGLILDYRQLMKLKSTYVDALPRMVNAETGRIHTSFNQAVAVTGRLSSSDPNLQNIPIRTELGRSIRKAFIAPPGHVLLSADYSQIELRIMAHLSGDPVLAAAFADGEDVHRKTASILFGIFPEMVSDDQRRQAKTINFGVMYGMGAYALSEQLGIPRGEAKRYIDNYFATHTGVSAFIERTIEEARATGYVSTLLGRRRSVADIHSKNHNIAEFAKRTAINTPIQGSAADMIKKAMIVLHRRLGDEKLRAALTLQVHDELVLEVDERDVEPVTAAVRESMEGAMKLDVPVVVEIGTGHNWLEAH